MIRLNIEGGPTFLHCVIPAHCSSTPDTHGLCMAKSCSCVWQKAVAVYGKTKAVYGKTKAVYGKTKAV
mgnify:CR=1 FL=1